MALQFYTGCSGSGKSYSLYKHIIDESLKHPELTYLILVPEQYNLATQRQLISMHPKGGILNIDVLSFARLSHRVFEEVGYSRAKGMTIDDIGKNLILRHMANENSDKLIALSGVLTKLGYISEVKSVISEFMQYGIGDRELDSLIERSRDRGVLCGKLTDIRLLYGEFLKYINEKYITTEEILQRVRNAVHASKKLKRSVIALDGYTGFTPVQLDLIQALLENCVDVYLTLLSDPRDYAGTAGASEQELFYMSYKTRAALDRLCRKSGVELRNDVIFDDEIPARFLYDGMGKAVSEEQRSLALIHLERNLFRMNDNVYDRGDSNDSIHIFCGSTPEEEAIEAAVRIERLVRDEGYHYKDIAVVSGDMATYMNACSRAFGKYGIPFFVDKTVPILLNPMIEHIRALFNVILEDYSYEAMFAYLRLSDSGFEKNTVDRLENYVLKYGIKGHGRWNTKFIRKPKDMKEEELEALDRLREEAVYDIGLFIDELTDTDKPADDLYDVKVISVALYHYMVRAGLSERMKKLSAGFEEAHDAVRAGEYGRIYEEVCVLLEKMVRFLPDEKISLKEYAQLLDAGFSEIRTGVLPGTDDYVQVGDITRTRLSDIKALFFVGVNDGIIPPNAGPGGIISDMDREFLTEPGDIELAPTARMKVYTQRLYLYMLVTKPSRHLFISYSKLSEDGSSINPSYFVRTVRHMFPQVSVEYPDESIGNRVYCEESGYEYLTSALQNIIRTEDGEFKRDYLTLFRIYSDNEDYRRKTAFILDAAFSRGIFERKDEISRAVADAIYGREITCSITRLETYARCAYSHFLKYGLSLKERELFSFEAGDVGSVFHDTLQYYAQILKDRNLSWFDTDEEERDRIIDEAMERCISDEDYSALYGSFRTGYMINRIRRITKRTVDVLTEQLKRGSFIPCDFEFAFSSSNDYRSLNISLSDDEKLHLIGRIDRVDVCENEGKVYVKIIDYKSGNKSFDLAAVYQGLDLQLVVYMNAAQEYISKRYVNAGDVIPAGILYYHIDDPLIEADDAGTITDEEINAAILKGLKMKGLVNSDDSIYRLIDKEFTDRSPVIPVAVKKDGELTLTSSVVNTEGFRILSDYVNHKIAEMGCGITGGNIKIEPHKRSASDPGPCVYCDYTGICGYRGEGNVYDEPDEILDDDSGDQEGEDRAGSCDIIDAMKRKLENG